MIIWDGTGLGSSQNRKSSRMVAVEKLRLVSGGRRQLYSLLSRLAIFGCCISNRSLSQRCFSTWWQVGVLEVAALL